MNSNCSNLLEMRNIQEQVKKAFCYQKLFWPFTVWINCTNDLKKKFSRSLEQFFLSVGQNNFGNKIPFLTFPAGFYYTVTNVIDNINNNNDNNNHNSQQNNVNNNNQFKYQIVMMWKIKAMLELFLMKKPMLMLLHM